MARDLNNLKIILGLSGGVDSAVAAVLLQDAGADVQALHMTNWEDEDGYCTAADDLQDARNVCEQLNITLHHVNFAKQYRDRVFQYFLDEYSAGRTPNPDVLCNREIKFGVFREHAQRLGGDLLATGHYARTTNTDGQTQLLKAVDLNKDQSYFLHAVSSEALAETVFSLGDLRKKDVRQIARDRGLAVHDKKDSTGICFIGERPFREFLSTYLPANPGPIQTPDGREVGQHHGLMYYTLGQRQGLGIGGQQDASDEPWYVVDKRAEDNALIVDQGNTELLLSDSLVAIDAAWINGPPAGLRNGLRCMSKIRYRQADQPCIVEAGPEGSLLVRFDEPQRAVAPGQYAVFYNGDCCLGGAVIDQISRNHAVPSAIMRPPDDLAGHG
jgi:tRNA-specific 2-thiouridylase